MKLSIGIAGNSPRSHCPNIDATIISSMKVYDWLTFSEYSTLSEIEFLITEWFFSIRCSECRICIHCNGNSTNWSIFKNNFLKELVFSGGDDKYLFYNVHEVVLHGSICKHVRSCPVIIVLDRKATGVNWTINNA